MGRYISQSDSKLTEDFYKFLTKNDDDLSENLHDKLSELYSDLDAAAAEIENKADALEETNAELITRIAELEAAENEK